MKKILFVCFFCLLLSQAPAVIAGRFFVEEVWFDPNDTSEWSHLVTTNARARYFGTPDRNDMAAILQTTVATNNGESSDASIGANLSGPFTTGQTLECTGSCGARLYIRKRDCPVGPGMAGLNKFYGGTGKVAIYHQGSPEIHIKKAVAQQVPCNPRLIEKYGVWKDGEYPVPGPYRNPHIDLDLCFYRHSQATVTVTDPTTSYTTITDYWDEVCY